MFTIEMILTNLYDPVFLRITALHHLPFVFVIPGLCLALAYVFEWITNNKYFKWGTFIFSFLGMYSLEIYLSHMSLRHSPYYLYIPIAIICGYTISHTIKPIFNKLYCE